MSLTRGARRRRALATPFPPDWRQLLNRNVVHWAMLDQAERTRAEELVRLLLVDKYWEAAVGFELTEEMRLTVAALASVLILGLDYDYYHRVTSIIVHPSTMVVEGDRHVGGGIFTSDESHLLGLASHDGPVVLSWEAVRDGARHPEGGRNVVYHEFAHKLDMLSGSVDGTPPLETPAQYDRWVEVCTAEYRALRQGRSGGLLDPYGGTDRGEFFAVATEVFFDRSRDLQAEKPLLYSVLKAFYCQDPAARERRAERG